MVSCLLNELFIFQIMCWIARRTIKIKIISGGNDRPSILLILLMVSFLLTLNEKVVLGFINIIHRVPLSPIYSTNHPEEMNKTLPPDFFKSVYNTDSNSDPLSSQSNKTPWDIGGGKPQPDIVRCFEEGKLKGRILDAGCGAGENCVYLGKKGQYGGITNILGFDLAPAAIDFARTQIMLTESKLGIQRDKQDKFWTRPEFIVASCTDIADVYLDPLVETNDKESFDVVIDSGLLHCLSDEHAIQYLSQITQLVKPGTGRAYLGCFSTANPDPWNNPRRLSKEYLHGLFCQENGWEILSVRDTWWSRPPSRGSAQGAFSMALWMEAKRLD